jgi:hypothetical protein
MDRITRRPEDSDRIGPEESQAMSGRDENKREKKEGRKSKLFLKPRGVRPTKTPPFRSILRYVILDVTPPQIDQYCTLGIEQKKCVVDDG